MYLDKLKAWFDRENKEVEPTEDELRLATTALLVEMVRADFEDDPKERQAVLDILRLHYSVSSAEAEVLFESAETHVNESVSLHEFTVKLHKRLSAKDKNKIVGMMWKVALSDGDLDRHEDHLVRKVADLLYVNHSDVVRIKHLVMKELSGLDDS